MPSVSYFDLKTVSYFDLKTLGRGWPQPLLLEGIEAIVLRTDGNELLTPRFAPWR
jgi:hypothetical protein